MVLTQKDQDDIEKALTNYFDSRQQILDKALDLLQGESGTPEQKRIEWEDHLNKRGTAALNLVEEALKYKAATPFTTAVRDILFQESTFFPRLGKMPFPDVMYASIQGYRKQFEEEKKNLLGKWNSLKGENSSINASIEEAVKQVQALYENALQKALSAKDIIRINIKSWLKTLNALAKPTGYSLPGEIITLITTTADHLNSVMPGAKELVSRFDRLYRSEDNVVLIMFGNTRKSVKEFLEKTNLDKAQKEYNEALQSANNIAGNMLTTAQQEDAKNFVIKAEANTQKPFISFRDAYQGFVNEFKEIFIGPVGEKTVKELINKDSADRNKENWRRLNVQTELKKLYDDNRAWISADMNIWGDIHPDQVPAIKAALQKDLDRLDLAVNIAGDRNILDSVATYLTIVKETTFSKAKDS